MLAVYRHHICRIVPKGGYETSDRTLEAAVQREAYEEGPPPLPLYVHARVLHQRPYPLHAHSHGPCIAYFSAII